LITGWPSLCEVYDPVSHRMFKMITYFCGKDNLDEKTKVFRTICFYFTLSGLSKIMSSTKPKGFEECCSGVTRFNS
jgi:hypothetical protein